MFSPLNDPQVEQWFARLNAPLKRLPVEERAQLHQEVRQHLESLVAANEELGSTSEEAWEHALTQFGDPARIGRRLAWEWRRGQGWVSLDMAAVLYTLGAHIISTAALFFCTGLVMTALHLVMTALHLYNDPGTFLELEFLVGVPLLAGTATGKRFPHQAMPGTFYAVLTWPFFVIIGGVVTSTMRVDPSDLPTFLLWPATWLTLGCGAAYAASARRRRQWYRPRLSDFMLRLPRRRAEPFSWEKPSLWV